MHDSRTSVPTDRIQPGDDDRPPFLTAQWVNLIMLTFPAPEQLVRSTLHPALSPDYWNHTPHVSLVAFDFRDTRVKKWRIPGCSNFPEINLRTYARRGSQRGVVFIKELVPSSLVALVARVVYNEPYQRYAMSSHTRTSDDGVTASHRFGRYWLRLTGSTTATVPGDDSVEHHFKEHEWGFGTRRDGALLRYRVEHPTWAIREVRHAEYDVDFRELYGAPWGFLNQCRPVSTIFAVGSPVRIYPPQRL